MIMTAFLPPLVDHTVKIADPLNAAIHRNRPPTLLLYVTYSGIITGGQVVSDYLLFCQP